MEINLNKGVSNNLLTNNSRSLRNNKISFSGNPLAALGPKKLMNKIPEKWWQKLSDKIPEKWFAGNFAKKVIDTAVENAALLEAGVALGLATTLRPASIMVVPGPPKDDRKYAAAKSIATGIVGFAFTAAVFIPIAAATKNLGKLAKDNLLIKTGFPEVGSARYKVIEYLTTYASKFIVAPLEAMALFAMVPPIVHKFLDKKDKKTPAPSAPKPELNQEKKGKV